MCFVSDFALIIKHFGSQLCSLVDLQKKTFDPPIYTKIQVCVTLMIQV